MKLKHNLIKYQLSVILVNFNAGDFLIKTLKSLIPLQSKIDLDVWVVDNDSSDDSIARAKKVFPQFNFIENKTNLGFGAANNIALRKVKTKYILLLNPDTEIEKGTVEFLLDFMENNPEVGASTCRIVRADGSIDWAAHRGFPTPWASLLYFLGNDSLYHLSKKDMEITHEVDAIAGSFFLTRKSVLDKVGLFDEDYWMYAEDIDLSFRIKQAGFKIMYVPKVSALHLKGISSGIKQQSSHITTASQESRLRAFNSFYQTMKIFYKKNLAKNYPFFINWLVYLGIDIRWFLARRKLSV